MATTNTATIKPSLFIIAYVLHSLRALFPFPEARLHPLYCQGNNIALVGRIISYHRFHGNHHSQFSDIPKMPACGFNSFRRPPGILKH
jgi:hypothetical protein